ncbi:hypothetical protein ACFY5J_04565 [Peribacillus butanolivorans]|uniref:hypothetical protein n=1 Tax=Peribacillus butanolivorans TaxID=421767 RepID=UPI0036814061
MQLTFKRISQGGAGYSTLTAKQAEFYQRAMLERLINNVVFMNYGKKQNIPKRAGAHSVV